VQLGLAGPLSNHPLNDCICKSNTMESGSEPRKRLRSYSKNMDALPSNKDTNKMPERYQSSGVRDSQIGAQCGASSNTVAYAAAKTTNRPEVGHPNETRTSSHPSGRSLQPHWAQSQIGAQCGASSNTVAYAAAKTTNQPEVGYSNEEQNRSAFDHSNAADNTVVYAASKRTTRRKDAKSMQSDRGSPDLQDLLNRDLGAHYLDPDLDNDYPSSAQPIRIGAASVIDSDDDARRIDDLSIDLDSIDMETVDAVECASPPVIPAMYLYNDQYENDRQLYEPEYTQSAVVAAKAARKTHRASQHDSQPTRADNSKQSRQATEPNRQLVDPSRETTRGRVKTLVEYQAIVREAEEILSDCMSQFSSPRASPTPAEGGADLVNLFDSPNRRPVIRDHRIGEVDRYSYALTNPSVDYTQISQSIGGQEPQTHRRPRTSTQYREDRDDDPPRLSPKPSLLDYYDRHNDQYGNETKLARSRRMQTESNEAQIKSHAERVEAAFVTERSRPRQQAYLASNKPRIEKSYRSTDLSSTYRVSPDRSHRTRDDGGRRVSTRHEAVETASSRRRRSENEPDLDEETSPTKRRRHPAGPNDNLCSNNTGIDLPRVPTHRLVPERPKVRQLIQPVESRPKHAENKSRQSSSRVIFDLPPKSRATEEEWQADWNSDEDAAPAARALVLRHKVHRPATYSSDESSRERRPVKIALASHSESRRQSSIKPTSTIITKTRASDVVKESRDPREDRPEDRSPSPRRDKQSPPKNNPSKASPDKTFKRRSSSSDRRDKVPDRHSPHDSDSDKDSKKRRSSSSNRNNKSPERKSSRDSDTDKNSKRRSASSDRGGRTPDRDSSRHSDSDDSAKNSNKSSTSKRSQSKEPTKLRKDWIKCERFEGNTSFEVFMCQFSNNAEYNGWSDADKLSQLKAALRGRAAQVLIGELGAVTSFAELERGLRAQFGVDGQSAQHRDLLRMRRRKPEESLQDLFLDVSRLITLAYPGPRSDLGETLGAEAFITSLGDADLELRVRDRFPATLNDAFQAALRLESNTRNSRTPEPTREPARERDRERRPAYKNNNRVQWAHDSRSNSRNHRSNSRDPRDSSIDSRERPQHTADNSDAIKNLERRIRQVEVAPANNSNSNTQTELDGIRSEYRRLRDEFDRLKNSDTDKDRQIQQLKQKYDEMERQQRPAPPVTHSQPSPGPARVDNDRNKCYRCGQQGHWSKDCSLPPPPPRGEGGYQNKQNYQNRDNQNYRGGNGYFQRNDFRGNGSSNNYRDKGGNLNKNFNVEQHIQGEQTPNQPQREQVYTRTMLPTCLHCNRYGHSTEECYSKPYPPDPKPPSRASGITTLKASAIRDEPRSARKTYLDLKIQGISRGFLLDTGCEVSVIPLSFVPHHRLQESDYRIFAANGIEIPIAGRLTVPLRINALTIPTTVEVSAHINEGMLGIDFLDQNKAQWNFDAGTITLKGHTFDLRRRPEDEKRVCRVYAQLKTDVPAHSEAIVSSTMTYPNRDVIDTDWATEPNLLKSGLQVARVLLPSRLVDVPVRVLNTTDHPITVEASAELTECAAVNVNQITETQPTSNDLEHLEKLIEGVDPSVSDAEKQQLRTLLHAYQDVFSTSEMDLGRTDIVKHRIDTGEHRPIRQALRRHPITQLPDIDSNVELMLAQGIIEPSNSPWASNVVIVTKKDGAIRFCIDYRQLNTITRKDSYPLPRIEACLDALGGSSFFSAFDLRSGYHQVEMEECDKDKTSFVTRTGLYRFCVMPFGLCNAPGTFQRIMDIVMAGLNFRVLLVYLDDIILFSKSVEEHLERLELLFTTLRTANLKLKPSKCKLIRREVGFLGHIVSDKGISTDPDKISAVQDWPVPTSVTEVRSFLGLCGYYRRFVSHFSEIAAPLHALTGKHVTFQWGDKCQTAFETLKQRLTTSPILSMPTDEGEYRLDTDASNVAIGAVLSQIQDGQEKVIAYASRTLSGPERNYCVTRKELLAVVYYAKHFRPYLLGRTFVIRTDHSALGWLRRTPQPIGQQARWLEVLEEFHYTIEHRAGRLHGNADALSRKPCKQCQQEDGFHAYKKLCPITVTAAPIAPVGVATDNPTTIAQAQQADTEIAFVHKLFSDKSARPTWDEMLPKGRVTKALITQWDSLVLKDSVLYRKFETAVGDSHHLQLIVPKSLQNDFMTRAHTGLTGGHLGYKRTKAQISKRGYWVGWTSSVSRFCASCAECTTYHRGKPKRQGLLHPMSLGEPFERISIDITGPHPKSKAGHVYILTVIDPFTKWAEGFAIRTHDAPTVAKTLIEQIFTRFGVPMQILSDRGPEFEGHLMHDLCTRLAVDKIRTTAYKASTNGAIERFHRTLNSMLGKCVSENQRDWHERLPHVLAAYRASKHDATGYTPNFLVLGREVLAPMDLVYGVPEEDADHDVNSNEFVEHKLKIISESYELVRTELGRSSEHTKRYYDLRARPIQYKVGQWVWVYYPRRYIQRSPKWQRFYQGPYLITRKLNELNFAVQKSARSQPFVVHTDKLKPCLSTTPVSWLQNGLPTDDVAGQPADVRIAEPKINRKRKPLNDSDEDENSEEEIIDRPRRQAKRPARYDDYV
jgi:RNase H-like domain found in reverse transcriptase/Reverse transcriptase (RNA-dependent DNA polymerase)/Integrase core domain/Integrase zinc binding domain/Zinc knuckle